VSQQCSIGSVVYVTGSRSVFVLFVCCDVVRIVSLAVESLCAPLD